MQIRNDYQDNCPTAVRSCFAVYGTDPLQTNMSWWLEKMKDVAAMLEQQMRYREAQDMYQQMVTKSSRIWGPLYWRTLFHMEHLA